MERQYLTDDELNNLIEEIESGDEACINPDILESILEKIEPKEVKRPPKKREFTLYCIKVGISVAAAVLVLLLTPELVKNMPTMQKDLTKQEVLCKENYMTKEEAIHTLSNSHVTIQIFDKEMWNMMVNKEN